MSGHIEVDFREKGRTMAFNNVVETSHDNGVYIVKHEGTSTVIPHDLIDHVREYWPI